MPKRDRAADVTPTPSTLALQAASAFGNSARIVEMFAVILDPIIRAAVAQAEAERDEARAVSASLQATIRKLTAPIEADDYPMPARNDPEFATKRFAFAREANERVWDALAIPGHPGAGPLWGKEGKAAKAAGLYAPATYYYDAGTGLKGKLRNAGIPVAGDRNAKRAAAPDGQVHPGI